MGICDRLGFLGRSMQPIHTTHQSMTLSTGSAVETGTTSVVMTGQADNPGQTDSSGTTSVVMTGQFINSAPSLSTVIFCGVLHCRLSHLVTPVDAGFGSPSAVADAPCSGVVFGWGWCHRPLVHRSVMNRMIPAPTPRSP